MSRCATCSHCKLFLAKHDRHKVIAKCTKLSGVRLQGKVILYAMDTVEVSGYVRVKHLLEKRVTPCWCPLLEEVKLKEYVTLEEYFDVTGITQGALAAKLGISEALLSKLKTGKTSITEEFAEKFYGITGKKLLTTSTYEETLEKENERLRAEISKRDALIVSLQSQVEESRAFMDSFILKAKDLASGYETYNLDALGIYKGGE